MRKITILLVLLISIFAFNYNVLAASGSLSVSSSNVYVGDNFTVSVNISASAAWNVHVSASGPVSGCSIKQADATADAMDTNKTFTASCTATGEGVITVRLSGDVTSAIDGNAVNISGSKNINVSKKIEIPSNTGGGNNNNTNNNSNNYVNNKSNNNNIKELSVDGYNLVKVDSNNYTLEVANDISSINVNAVAEDSKAVITGIGNHQLSIGQNNIEIIVTSESGLQNKIYIKVTRKDGYYLEDLETLLKNNNSNKIDIIIKSDTRISSNILDEIKKSKKIINFNYYDENKNLIYSWIINGSKLNNNEDFSTTILYDSENKKEILQLSNYADGLYINLKNINYLPDKTKIKLYVGDKYDNNDMVNIYGYIKNENKLNLIKNKIKVNNGYIEFDAIAASDYLITMSNVPNLDKVTTNSSKTFFGILSIIICLLILIFIIIMVLYILKKKKNDNNKPNNFNTNSDLNYNNIESQNNNDNIFKQN